MPTVLALVGPTGTGKSALAVAAAQTLGAAVLNCDSVQCYRQFDIGSAKPPASERGGVPHYLFDLASATEGPENFGAGAWLAAAHAALAALRVEGRPALLCGGTGLYLRALRQGLIEVPAEPTLRARWQAEETAEPGRIYRALHALDPLTAKRIGPTNPHRLLRALEIALVTGRLPSELWRAHQARADPHLPDVRPIVLEASRDWLEPRLLARAERMVAEGLLEEVAGLLSAGASPSAMPMRSVGYYEAQQVLAGKLAPAALASAIAERSWQYARRQRTWFRREPAIVRLDAAVLADLSPSARTARLLELWRQPTEATQGP